MVLELLLSSKFMLCGNYSSPTSSPLHKCLHHEICTTIIVLITVVISADQFYTK